MKIKNFITVLFVAFILASCAPAFETIPTDTAIPTITISPRAENFAFIFQDYSCGSIPVNVLDSFNGTLIHTPLGDTTSVTISLRLTDSEIESIYQKAVSIGFFEYPSEFVIPDDQVRGYHSPYSSYQLSMTNSAMTNSITWKDDTMTKPSYTKADKLRALINLIDEILQAHPEMQNLPEPKAACL